MATTMGTGIANARWVEVGSEEYHQIPAVSCSMLKAFERDPEQCYDAYVARIAEHKTSKAFDFGIRLERMIFFDEHPKAAVVPQEVCQRRQKANCPGEYTYARTGAAFLEWKERTLAELGADALLLTQAEFDKEIAPLLIAYERLREHPVASKLLWGAGQPHRTLLWDDVSRGVPIPCKLQTDLTLNRGVIIDLKSISPSNSETKADLARHCWSYRYHWQQWWYQHAVQGLTGKLWPFAFVFVQSESPFRVTTLELDAEFLELAEYQVRTTFADLASCWTSGVWRTKDFGQLVKLKAPRWAKAAVEDETY